MDSAMTDFYAHALLGSFSQVCATTLSALTGEGLSHDRITRALNERAMGARDLWRKVRSLVETLEGPDGVLIIDETIVPKPYMDESPIVCWHFDHTQSRPVKGIMAMTALYDSCGVSLPVDYELVSKTATEFDPKRGREHRVSEDTRNERFRRLALRSSKKLRFSYVLGDIWYGSAETMQYIHEELKRHFIFALKGNRKVALSRKDQRAGRFTNVERLFTTRTGCRQRVWLPGMNFPVVLVSWVFKDGDASPGILYLVCSDLSLKAEAIVGLYQRRWTIEEYHKALKQQCAIGRSPARTVKAQSTHIFCALWAYVKLELLHMSSGASYEAIKRRLYEQALKAAFRYLPLLDLYQYPGKALFA